MKRPLITALIAVGALALPAAASADTCPNAGTAPAPPASTGTVPGAPSTPAPAPAAPAPAPAAPAAPSAPPTPASTTPPANCDCGDAICASRREFDVRLVEKGGRIRDATVQVEGGGGIKAGPENEAARRGGRMRAHVSFKDIGARRGQIVSVLFKGHRSDGSKFSERRFYRMCAPGKKTALVNRILV